MVGMYILGASVHWGCAIGPGVLQSDQYGVRCTDYGVLCVIKDGQDGKTSRFA